MLRWLRSRFEGTKGQFFVISVVIITVSIVGIMNVLSTHGELHLTEFHSYEEDRLFRNIKEGIEHTAETSECPSPRKRNLREFKDMAEEDIRMKGGYLNITYRDYCPEVDATVVMKFPSFEMRDSFEVS